MDLHIVNNAAEVPFSFILQELISGNVEKSVAKQKVYGKMKGITAIDLPDIEAAVTLVFDKGTLTIEPGIMHDPAIIITTSSDLVTDLNMLNIRWGLPWYFDKAGRLVLKHIMSGTLKISGMFTHPVLLNRLTVIMSVI